MRQASVSSGVTGRCPRCHTTLRPGAKKCPECGEILRGMTRRTSFYVGLVGMLLMLAVVLVGLLLTPNSPEETQDFEDPDAETPAKAEAPSPPPKEPPLNR